MSRGRTPVTVGRLRVEWASLGSGFSDARERSSEGDRAILAPRLPSVFPYIHIRYVAVGYTDRWNGRQEGGGRMWKTVLDI